MNLRRVNKVQQLFSYTDFFFFKKVRVAVTSSFYQSGKKERHVLVFHLHTCLLAACDVWSTDLLTTQSPAKGLTIICLCIHDVHKIKCPTFN